MKQHSQGADFSELTERNWRGKVLQLPFHCIVLHYHLGAGQCSEIGMQADFKTCTLNTVQIALLMQQLWHHHHMKEKTGREREYRWPHRLGVPQTGCTSTASQGCH